jgi:hypothetical protein
VTGYLGDCITSCVDRIDTRATVSGVVYLDGITLNPVVAITVGPTGRPVVNITDYGVVLDTLHLDIDWGLVEFLDDIIGLSNLGNALLAAFGNGITDLMEGQLQTLLGPIISEILSGYEPPSTVTLPQPMGTVLNFASAFDVIELRSGYARVGVSASVSAANPVVASPMGPVQRGGDVPTFTATPNAFGAAIKDDLLNQFLWAAWSGGALEIDDLAAFGCPVPNGFLLSMSATLPPVIMPGTHGHQVDIGFGDLYIEAHPVPGATMAASTFTEGDVAMYAATTVGATITIDPETDRFVVTLEENPDIAVQVVSAPRASDIASLTSQYTQIIECLMPTIAQTLLGAYPVPVMPVGVVSLPGVPANTLWVLSDGAVDRQDPYTTIVGDVRVK